MAAPTWVAAGTGVGSAAGISVGTPAGFQADDVLNLAAEHNQNQPVGDLSGSGWTQDESSPQPAVGSIGGSGLSLYRKISVGGEGNQAVPDVGNHVYGVQFAIRGADTADPVAISSGGIDETAGTSLVLPSITTPVDECLVVHVLTTSLDSTSPAWSTWGNSFTQRFSGGTDAGGGGGIVIATKEVATAGAVGTTSVTTPAELKSWITLVFAPTSGGPTVHTAGPLSVSGSGAITAADSLVVRVAGPLSVAGTGAITIADDLAIRMAGPLAVAGSGLITISDDLAIRLAGPLSVAGSGLITVGSAESIIMAGPLAVAGSGLITIADAAVIEPGDIITAGPLSVSGTGAISVEDSLAIRLAGPLAVAGTGELLVLDSEVIAGEGVIILAGPLSMEGAARITLRIKPRLTEVPFVDTTFLRRFR